MYSSRRRVFCLIITKMEKQTNFDKSKSDIIIITNTEIERLTEHQFTILKLIYEITKTVSFDLNMLIEGTLYNIHPNTIRSALKLFLFLGLIKKTGERRGDAQNRLVYDMTSKGEKFYENYKY